jgi:hypothetical protein
MNNVVLEYLLFSVHVILFHIVASGIFRRNIPVANVNGSMRFQWAGYIVELGKQEVHAEFQGKKAAIL